MSEVEERGGQPAAVPVDQLAMEQARKTHVRMTLIQQFHLDSAFIGVPKLAGILGLSPSTIWGYIRERKFFIPYRMFNKSPVVCIDDLVEWYCASDGLIRGEMAPEPPAAAASLSDGEGGRESDIDDAVEQALASIGIDPKSKRRSLRAG